MTLRLFPDVPAVPHGGDSFTSLGNGWPVESLAEGAWLLRGFAIGAAQTLWREIERVIKEAPLRQMSTPGGQKMSVRTTSCGEVGWVSDRKGYRYAACDPESNCPWPALPESFLHLAQTAATEAGYAGFVPDSCLINRYDPGTRMSLHQDKDERDFAAPIVSVSLGFDAVFLFGGLRRNDRPSRTRLYHGDVVVWGGPARLRFHGVLPIASSADGPHPLIGPHRFNLTLRKAT